jgi:hypothetical protein
MKKLEELVRECLNDGTKLTDIYTNIWNKFLEITENFPVSSQKRFFQLINSSKKLSFLPEEVSSKIEPLIKDLQIQKHLLLQGQEQIDEIVIKIYGLTKDNWIVLSLEND